MNVVETDRKFAAGVCSVHPDLRIIREFSIKVKMTHMLFSGAWEKMIHEKNMMQKSRDTAPFKLSHSLHLPMETLHLPSIRRMRLRHCLYTVEAPYVDVLNS